MYGSLSYVCCHWYAIPGLTVSEHGEWISGIDFGTGAGQYCSLLEEEPLMGSRRRSDEFCDVVLHKASIDAVCYELGVLQQALQKRDVGGHSFDLELTKC